MRILFIHGMGRSQISGWPLLWRLKRAGFTTQAFDYYVSLESFEAIKRRLVKRLSALSLAGDYVVVAHSLGGVLVRAALSHLGPGIAPPRHVFLLGSPLRSPVLAKILARNLIYRMLTGDSGQFLGSAQRMLAVGKLSVPTTAIVGVRGFVGKRSPFKNEINDGVVAVAEVSAAWLTDQVQLPVMHTLLPASRQVSQVILQRLLAQTRSRN